MNLQNWVAQAGKHWREFQPKRYARLKKAGTLEKELQAAARLTYQELQQWIEKGAPYPVAFEAVRQNHLFPPEEPELKAREAKEEEEFENERPMSAYKAFKEMNEILQSEDKEEEENPPLPIRTSL